MNIEENTYRNFELSYPWVAKDAESYKMFGVFQLIVYLKSGEKVLYDDFENTIEHIDDEMDEEVWARWFSKNLRMKIRFAGLDQNYISEKTGISKSMISRYVNGRSIPNVYNACKLAEVLGCTIDDFLKFPE